MAEQSKQQMQGNVRRLKEMAGLAAECGEEHNVVSAQAEADRQVRKILKSR